MNRKRHLTELEELARPLANYLLDNFGPRASFVLTNGHATLVEEVLDDDDEEDFEDEEEMDSDDLDFYETRALVDALIGRDDVQFKKVRKGTHLVFSTPCSSIILVVKD